jgi:hypothetical protein
MGGLHDAEGQARAGDVYPKIPAHFTTTSIWHVSP